MKKTINGLLLAMAVCAGPSYGVKWDDDTQMQTMIKGEDRDRNNAQDAWKNLQKALQEFKRIESMIHHLVEMDLYNPKSTTDVRDVIRNIREQNKIMKEALEYNNKALSSTQKGDSVPKSSTNNTPTSNKNKKNSTTSIQNTNLKKMSLDSMNKRSRGERQ